MERNRLSSHLLFGCICLSLAGWLGGVVANESTLTVDSVQLGLPISSMDGEGAVDGSLFSGDFGEMTISVDSNNPTGYMSVWMQVNVSGASVSYYEWEIVGWKDQQPYGELSYYDEVIDIDPVLESYRVKTVGNAIRYDSTTNSLLSSNHIELIRVTAWTTDGYFTTAYFHLTLSLTETSQLADLFFSAGFAPSAPNSTLIVQVSDLHIDPGENYFPTPIIDDRLVNAINELEFLPDELVVTGDTAISRSPTAGDPRFLSHELLAIEEMEAAVIEMQRFDSRMRQWIIPGNHDTDAQDDQPDLWSEILGYPAFQRADISGVPVFFLNGKNSGDLDATQLAWLQPEFATIADDQDIIVFVHQPSLNQIAVERGIKRELVQALAGRSGRVWVFSGHKHRFRDDTYIENGTQFIQTVVTTGNSEVFSSGENPGYGLIGLQNGRVVFRIFKDVKNSNHILLPPVLPGEGKAFIWPYEDVDFPVLIRDEGTYSRDDYSFQILSRDTGTWLSYVSYVSWQLPLSAYDENVNEVLVLGGGGYFCEFSPDRTDGSWESAGVFHSIKRVFRIPIPVKFIGTDVFFKATSVQESAFAGWGLSVPFPEDTDGDGIDDWYETSVLGTNPNSVDSDSDGLVDGAGDVVDVNDYPGGGGIDIDGDGFVDGEQDFGTSPTNNDSDGDGISDGDEISLYGIDPTVSNVGDVGPRGSSDNVVNVGDLVVLTRFVMGIIQPTALESILGDMNNDSELNAADILLLQQAVLNGAAP